MAVQHWRVEWLRGDTPHPRSGVATLRRYTMFKVSIRGHEETPNFQGKEQWLCFAGALAHVQGKRKPSKK